jgi:hypothetical protein
MTNQMGVPSDPPGAAASRASHAVDWVKILKVWLIFFLKIKSKRRRNLDLDVSEKRIRAVFSSSRDVSMDHAKYQPRSRDRSLSHSVFGAWLRMAPGVSMCEIKSMKILII